MAVCRRVHNRLSGNIAGGTRPVIDEDLLAQTVGQPLSDQARDDVDLTARRKAHDNAHWLRRIGLRLRNPRHGGERGNTCCQMQKSTARQVHGV
jgi:hypothetical protein